MLESNIADNSVVNRARIHDMSSDPFKYIADGYLDDALSGDLLFRFTDLIASTTYSSQYSLFAVSRTAIEDLIKNTLDCALQWVDLDYSACCEIENQISRVSQGCAISSTRDYFGKITAEGSVRVHVERIASTRELIAAKIERLHRTHALPAIEMEKHAALLIAEDAERRRVARELHDGTAQHVALAHLMLEKMRGEHSFGQIDAAIAQIELAIASAQREIQLIEMGCQPCELDRCSLAEAITAFLKRFSAYTSLRTHFTENLGRLAISSELQCTIFRIVQEAVVNVERHADARVVQLDLSQISGQIILEISDDGIGIPNDIAVGDRTEAVGVGLSGMRERAKMHGGTFSISSLGSGTRVCARFPKSS